MDMEIELDEGYGAEEEKILFKVLEPRPVRAGGRCWGWAWGWGTGRGEVCCAGRGIFEVLEGNGARE